MKSTQGLLGESALVTILENITPGGRGQSMPSFPRKFYLKTPVTTNQDALLTFLNIYHIAGGGVSHDVIPLQSCGVTTITSQSHWKSVYHLVRTLLYFLGSSEFDARRRLAAAGSCSNVQRRKRSLLARRRTGVGFVWVKRQRVEKSRSQLSMWWCSCWRRSTG